MKKTAKIFKFTVVMILCVVMLSLTACSTAVTLAVTDMGKSTEVEATTGMTVAEVLESAQISLSDKDETEPAQDEKITEETKEIIIKRYAKVTVVKDDDKKVVELVGGTVDEAIEQAGFTLADDEVADFNGDELLTDGMTITISKKLNVTLTADGNTETIGTAAKTVEDFLKEQEVALSDDDELSVKLTDAITEGMNIVVKRVEYKEETRTESIDYSTQEKYSDSLPAGTSEVTQEGVKGSKEVTYKVKYVDSKEDSKEVVSEKVTKEPVDKIITYSSQSSSSTSQGSSNSSSGTTDSGRTVVSKQAVYDCDGSGHGYYVITYSDGTVEYEEF